MIKKLIGDLDYSSYAEVALVLFAAVFLLVVIRTLLTRSDVTRHQAHLVLGDSPDEKQENQA